MLVCQGRDYQIFSESNITFKRPYLIQAVDRSNLRYFHGVNYSIQYKYKEHNLGFVFKSLEEETIDQFIKKFNILICLETRKHLIDCGINPEIDYRDLPRLTSTFYTLS